MDRDDGGKYAPRRDARRGSLARWAGGLALGVLCAGAKPAGAQASYTAPSTSVGSTSATQVATVTFSASGTLGSVNVLTQGAPNLDFKLVTGGTCVAGMPYTAGQSCTLLYSFAPAAPGRRLGGVLLKDDSATPVVLGTAYITGLGESPLADLSVGVVSYPITGLDNAQGLAFDGAGDYYVGGGGSNVVSEYSPSGVLLATLGSGLNYPTGVAVDGVGNVFATNEEEGQLVEFPAGGGPQTVVASGLGYPFPLIVDGAGNLYTGIGDNYETGGVAEISPSGTVTMLAGQLIAAGLAMDSSGNIFVSDYISGTIKRIAEGSGIAAPFYGGTAGMNPYGIAVDPAGNVYVGEYTSLNSGQLIEIAPSGSSAVTLFNTGAQTNYLVLGATGALYFGDKPNNRIGVFNRSSGAVAFPTTPLGASSAQDVVTLENDGNTSLTVDSIGITGEFNLGGAGTTCAAGILSAGASCGMGVVFAPTAEGAASGSLNVTDNTLNAAGTVQTVALSAIGGPKAITFPQPSTPVLVNTMATLNATVSNGDSVTYSIVAGTATLAGSQITYTTVGTVTIEADSAATGGNSPAAPVQRSVQVQNQSMIAWTPASYSAYAGVALGAGVLDATASEPGSFAYTATNAGGMVTSITASSGLPPGVYTLTAAFTPSSDLYSTASASITFTVVDQEVFIANAAGSVASLLDGGEVQSGPAAGGGIGAAVDASGYVWSIDAGGASVAKFSDAGIYAADYSGAGIASATALAIDGNGVVWIANAGSVSAMSSAGTPVSATPVAQAGTISAPNSISVDAAGSLWLANTGNGTVTEVIGVAAPVSAPTVTQVIGGSPATKP